MADERSISGRKTVERIQKKQPENEPENQPENQSQSDTR